MAKKVLLVVTAFLNRVRLNQAGSIIVAFDGFNNLWRVTSSHLSPSNSRRLNVFKVCD